MDSAPHALTEPVAFGRFSGFIADPRLARWDAARLWRRRLQRKAWLYCGLYEREHTLGFAILDAGLISVAFCYVNGVEEKLTVPLGFPAAFSPRLDATWELARGSRRFSVRPYAGGWELRCQGPRLDVTAHVEHDVRGLTAVVPVAGRPFAHTYKSAGLTADARAVVDGKELRLEGRIGAVDFTAGYPARRTFWNWASAAGPGFGLNLCAPFNDGLENAAWLDGKLVPLPPVRFTVDPWTIRSPDGAVDLTFTPRGERRENLNLGLLVSRFRQPYGRFSGSVLGRVIDADGVCEDHTAVW
jgi:hypothetical protein